MNFAPAALPVKFIVKLPRPDEFIVNRQWAAEASEQPVRDQLKPGDALNITTSIFLFALGAFGPKVKVADFPAVKVTAVPETVWGVPSLETCSAVIGGQSINAPSTAHAYEVPEEEVEELEDDEAVGVGVAAELRTVCVHSRSATVAVEPVMLGVKSALYSGVPAVTSVQVFKSER